MADTAAAKAPKKRAAGKPKVAPSHPPYASMVKTAIAQLKEPKGSSRQSIQKYLLAHYKFGDVNSVTVHLRVALRKLSDAGVIKHAKGGTGASGSFRLGDKAKKATGSPKKPRVKKAAKPRAAGAKPKKSPKKKTAAKRAAPAAGDVAAAAPAPRKSPKKVARKSPAKKAAKPAKKSPKKTKSPKKKAAAKK